MNTEEKLTTTILLVDDEPAIRDMMADFLSAKSYHVLTARSGKEALGLLQRHSVDVVITDEEMPGMKGSELLVEVRRDYPETIRIMLTGKATLETAVNAINEGEIYRFFTKPCSLVDVGVTIEQALRQKELESENKRLAELVKQQRADYAILEKQCPGITEVKRDEGGVIIIDED